MIRRACSRSRARNHTWTVITQDVSLQIILRIEHPRTVKAGATVDGEIIRMKAVEAPPLHTRVLRKAARDLFAANRAPTMTDNIRDVVKNTKVPDDPLLSVGIVRVREQSVAARFSAPDNIPNREM